MLDSVQLNTEQREAHFGCNRTNRKTVPDTSWAEEPENGEPETTNYFVACAETDEPVKQLGPKDRKRKTENCSRKPGEQFTGNGTTSLGEQKTPACGNRKAI